MAPVRRPSRQPDAMPITDRCAYTEQTRKGTRRCARIATIGDFCRHHHMRIELELNGEHPLDEVIERVDRRIARNPDPFVNAIANAFGKLFGRHREPPQPPRDPRARPNPAAGREQPRARAAPPPPPPDPALLARELLGFEPTERLTIELVQKRKQALARVFHPDMPGGSEARMKRVNAAADLLLAKLSK